MKDERSFSICGASHRSKSCAKSVSKYLLTFVTVESLSVVGRCFQSLVSQISNEHFVVVAVVMTTLQSP